MRGTPGPIPRRRGSRRGAGSATPPRWGNAARAVWSPPALDDFLQDVKYAVRGLRRRPGYAAAAIVTIMLGIGATTALFSVLDAVLLKSLPYPDAGRLVQVWEHNLPRDRRENLVVARQLHRLARPGPELRIARAVHLGERPR